MHAQIRALFEQIGYLDFLQSLSCDLHCDQMVNLETSAMNPRQQYQQQQQMPVPIIFTSDDPRPRLHQLKLRRSTGSLQAQLATGRSRPDLQGTGIVNRGCPGAGNETCIDMQVLIPG